jgi:hypothetical protein
VKLAEDGLIDVSDVREYARKLKADGNVKLSAADDIFVMSPGSISDDAAPEATLDPLTRVLRGLSSTPV